MEQDVESRIINRCLDAGVNIAPDLLERLSRESNPLAAIERILRAVCSRGNVPAVISCSNVDEDGPAASFSSPSDVALNEDVPWTGDAVEPRTGPAPPPPRRRTKERNKKSPARAHPLPVEGVSTFHPLAREVEERLDVLVDPTPHLFTNGDVTDFLSLFNDRFERLERLLRRRRGMNNRMRIAELRAVPAETEVTIVGLVTDKRVSKKGNLVVELEDPTGYARFVVSKKNEELSKRSAHLMEDQVICLEGVLARGESKSRAFIFAKDFYWANVDPDREKRRAEEKVWAALISDVHFGSKNHLPRLWDRFVDFINGRVHKERTREIAGAVKYLVIAGDLVDGIGVYPRQEEELDIQDIFDQFRHAERELAKIPEYVKIVYIPGNHEPVRNALPQPAVPTKYSGGLVKNLDVVRLGNPSTFSIHGVKVLAYHGDGLIDVNMTIPGLSHERPARSMIEFLRGRHLAPTYGKKTELAPCERDWLVVDEVPDLFHAGHIHVNGVGHYRGVRLVNSGCFQAQTSFMRSMGINPTPGVVPLTALFEENLETYELDLKEV
ncbi:MAG: hypothetical protein Kow0069_34450 [Promethearchaeota archaeon]